MSFFHDTASAWSMWRRGINRFYGIGFVYAVANDGSQILPWYRRLIWPWRFGWARTQMQDALFFGPGYFLWGA